MAKKVIIDIGQLQCINIIKMLKLKFILEYIIPPSSSSSFVVRHEFAVLSLRSPPLPQSSSCKPLFSVAHIYIFMLMLEPLSLFPCWVPSKYSLRPSNCSASYLQGLQWTILNGFTFTRLGRNHGTYKNIILLKMLQ